MTIVATSMVQNVEYMFKHTLCLHSFIKMAFYKNYMKYNNDTYILKLTYHIKQLQLIQTIFFGWWQIMLSTFNIALSGFRIPKHVRHDKKKQCEKEKNHTNYYISKGIAAHSRWRFIRCRYIIFWNVNIGEINIALADWAATKFGVIASFWRFLIRYTFSPVTFPWFSRLGPATYNGKNRDLVWTNYEV